ncbi:hypothetical protein DFH07DRAFT_963141 [Mycena maculata]|uniref:Uncharacterized protein n=1 Tax=Mycena maculata TaxID=230809 RepID=A0AAD7N4V1_9AGAR|nr:hypothetical protein DFH07DRAFT_963141 [Mycena maculata]
MREAYTANQQQTSQAQGAGLPGYAVSGFPSAPTAGSAHYGLPGPGAGELNTTITVRIFFRMVLKKHSADRAPVVPAHIHGSLVTDLVWLNLLIFWREI